jgi:hypothetical protein
MKNLYVAFDDSTSDPTYANAEFAYLVSANSEADTNPCASKEAVWVSVAPNKESELRQYAELMGWKVKEKNGVFVLVTNIPV